ncbi:hypothetical protein Bca101_029669 [Brassica carinata]
MQGRDGSDSDDDLLRDRPFSCSETDRRFQEGFQGNLSWENRGGEAKMESSFDRCGKHSRGTLPQLVCLLFHSLVSFLSISHMNLIS